MAWESEFHGQWNRTPLVVQDQIAIGGPYSVRGFDGEMSLMGERGFYWRNTLGWQYVPGHQLYAAGGTLTYDLFVSRPLEKPAYFPTSRSMIGFSINWAF